MAITETRVVQVPNDPRVINTSNEAWRRWGWTVLGVQVTNSQDSHISGGSFSSSTHDGITSGLGTIEIETTVINYATITYQRDTGMENYEQIAALQRDYENSDARMKMELNDKYQQIEKMKQELSQLSPPDPIWVTGLKVWFGLPFFAIPSIITVRNAIRKRADWDEITKKYGDYNKRWDEVWRLTKEWEKEVAKLVEQDRERIIRERNRLFPA